MNTILVFDLQPMSHMILFDIDLDRISAKGRFPGLCLQDLIKKTGKLIVLAKLMSI